MTNSNVTVKLFNEAKSNNITNMQFIEGFRTTLKTAFYEKWDFNQQSYKRGIPTDILKIIMDYKPLSVCIPKQFGGRGDTIANSMAIMSEASYESLALSLMLSINYALFIQPVDKYGQEEVKGLIFKRFLEQNNMGGLMITEPDFGSDALNMQTSYNENSEYFHLTGKKHWAGLTGMANFWLLAARKSNDGKLKRDIDFFICDVEQSEQKIEVEEYFENLGLYIIPYGVNKIDVKIPKVQRLIPHSSGIKLMLDVLHRSRLQFPGMSMGFIRRILDEATNHSKQRTVGGRTLINYDQVKYRLSRLQVNYTICSALCIVGSEMADLEKDLTGAGFEANIIKCVTTDLMQESSQSLLQLFGAQGYKINHIAGRSTVDSRPFQIFEGSNDILYIQICDALIKKMQACNELNLYKFLLNFEPTQLAVDYISEQVNFTISSQLQQHKQMELGILISRVFALNTILKIQDRNFNTRLLESAKIALIDDITQLCSTYRYSSNLTFVDNYQDKSFWVDFVKV